MSDVAHIEAARRDYKNTLELIHRVMPAASGVVLGALSQLIKQRDEANARLAAAEADKKLADEALAEVQAALYRWLPSCDGGKYDDLIKADADKLLGMEYDADAREIGSEILAEKTAAESRLREYEDAPVVAWLCVDEECVLSDATPRVEVRDSYARMNRTITELIIRPRGGKGE